MGSRLAIRISTMTFARPINIKMISEMESCCLKLCEATLLSYRECLTENKAKQSQDGEKRCQYYIV